MGLRMVRKLHRDGHDVGVWNRSPQPVDELKKDITDLRSAASVEELIKSLAKPRVIWSMLPAGKVTQAMLTQIVSFVESGDIVINGGNEHFANTEKHFQDFKARGIRFLGVGVSGGIIAEQEGYPLMVGGDRSAYDHVIPILDSLSKPKGGHAYVGQGGAGHFVKMVHNAIEYGYMQAIGEGFGVLEKSKYSFDLAEIAKLYTKNTLIAGFMMDRTVDTLKSDPKLENLEGVIAESGEAKWTIEEAKKLGVPIENIEQSLEFRKRSQTEPVIAKSFAARMVAALRAAFGGHAVKKK